MKRSNLKKSMLWMAILAVLAVPVAAGQMGSHQGMGQGMGRGMPMYDPDAEITIATTIEEVNEESGDMGMIGIHLVVKADEETLEVHLGPSTYLADQGFAFKKGDHIELTGSRVKQEDATFLIAREVKKGDKVLTLRDEQGRPAWAGMGGTHHQGHQGKGRY